MRPDVSRGESCAAIGIEYRKRSTPSIAILLNEPVMPHGHRQWVLAFVAREREKAGAMERKSQIGTNSLLLMA
jgi:hypothetical protein